ncbi:hypothetical protein, partial [Proteus mirabilis]|uniref:hypothetical protein n=1 Tax=Proteus mirabilis TaxID=584 RepID=UPI0019547EBF
PNAGFFVDRALKELPLLRTDAETHDLTQRTFDDILQDICFEPPSPAQNKAKGRSGTTDAACNEPGDGSGSNDSDQESQDG